MKSTFVLTAILLSASAFASNDLNGTQVVCTTVYTKTIRNSSGMSLEDTRSEVKSAVLQGNQDHASADLTVTASYSGKLKRSVSINLDRYFNPGGEYRVLKLSTVIGKYEVSTEGSDSSVNIRIGGAPSDGITCVIK